ncbi:MAG: ThiF family adenylyltransferase [Bacteroidetes bacterium]|nr:ThiF family adenylyltransferase [Bacteroidota bacterium]
MSQQLIAHSTDLQRLRNEGYDIAVIDAHLVIRDVPYVTSDKEVAYGILATPLKAAGDVTIQPETHVAYFAGNYPCNRDGSEMTKMVIGSQDGLRLADGLIVQHTLSKKPFTQDFRYKDYYDLVTAYVELLSNPAKSLDPTVTAQTFPIIEATEQESVFQYLDTASSRAGIAAVSAKLAGGKIAIVGLGGTGSYILDLVAKTPVDEIHLFDGDEFSQHNAFRSPGAPTIDVLRSRPQKVYYFADLYSNMRRSIVPHHGYIDDTNVHQLQGLSFVFLCVDRGNARQLIVEALEAYNIPFIDVGMGVYLEADSMVLGGIVRVTTSTSQQREHVHRQKRLSFGDGIGNEYTQNIQIADLNALNAVMAVMKWKKLMGFYLDFEQEHHSTYTIDGNLLYNEDQDK